ncbi:unnamed protein product [Alopecurus aequalis]
MALEIRPCKKKSDSRAGEFAPVNCVRRPAGALELCCATLVKSARVRRTNRDRAAAPVLPDDLLLWEILVRLPAKEILRCRAACRSWRHLTCDNEFLVAHNHRQPSLPLVSFRSISGQKTSDVPFDVKVDAFDLWRTPAVRLPVLRFNGHKKLRSFSLHGSCDGLLLLSVSYHRLDHHFYLCNPATRQWLALPALNGGNVAALYHHRPSGEYRILYWKLPIPSKDTNQSDVYYVLTVGSSEGPRCIGLPVVWPDTTRWRIRFSEYDTTGWLVRACEHLPAMLHDSLHRYVPYDANTKVVVVFDTMVESFKWLGSAPIDTNLARLLQMDDGKVVFDNGDTLEADSAYFPRWTLQRSYLLHCNGKSKLLELYSWENLDRMVLGLCFKESLVRHVFFQRKGAGRVSVPSFFRGL